MRYILPILLFVATPAIAGIDHSHKHHHSAPAVSSKLAKNPAVKAYIAANKKMHKGMNVCQCGDADIDFTRGMIPHHQGAVDMANVVLKYGKDAEIKELAKRIIVAQESEIAVMSRWLEVRDNKKAKRGEAYKEEYAKGYAAAMDVMHKDMNIKYTGNADVDFARGMIPHHQGAIDMAKVLKKHGRDPMLRDLADDVIRSQGQEIRLMQEWLAKNKVK